MKVTIINRLLSVAVIVALAVASVFVIPAGGETEVYAKGAKEAASPNAKVAAAGFTADGVYYSILPGTARVQVGDGEHPAIPADSPPSINIPLTVSNDGISYTVTAVAAYAFDGRAISGISLPDSVRTIGNRAFRNCINLTGINLPTGLKTIEYWAFSGSGLKSVTIPGSVVQIFNGAFSSMPRLESAVFGDGVTELADNIFQSSSNLTSVTLPANLKRLADGAFYYCEKLNNIVIPASVEYIDRNAFYGCVSMADMIFNSTAPPEISPYNVFAMCDKLAAVHVPEGSAGNYTSALRGANLIAEVENATTVKIYSCFKSGGVTYKILSLSPKRVQVGSGFDCAVSAAESGTIHIPPQVIYGGISFTVTQVGTSAFSGCALSGAYLPDSVEYIGTGAFAYCANLESINLPERLESIANYAFFQSGLRSVVLPDSVTQIGWSVFSGASRLESATIGDGISSLANETFNNCRSLTDVTLTDSITRLENSAFSGCANLTGISLPASLEYIGSSTFSGCTGITSISMPASLRAIDSYAFSACSGLADINFAGASPPSLNGNTTFLGCDSLDLIRVPAGCTGAYRERLMDAGLATSVLDAASLKVLRNFTAGGVKYKVISADPFQVQIGDGISPAVPAALPTVEIPKTVESGGVNYTVTAVGRNAFSDCALYGVSLPDSVTSIGLNAFAGCGNLSEIDLPPNLNFIGDFAFSQSGLVSATIPGSVENFGNYAFAYSTQLESVVIKEGVRELSNVMFAGCTALTSVSLPDTLRNIRNAFSSCANLENISLPGAMETLAPFAFSNCVKLREISIPASVSSIGERAFFSCSKLSEITFGQETPPAISSDNVFTGAGMLGTIRVPDGSASRYLPVLNDAGLTVSLQDSVTLKILKSFESSDGVTYKVISSEPPMVQVGSGIAQAISSYRTEPVVIPEHVSNDGVEYKVTAVGREAFAVCNISGLTLPSGITSIGEMAFAMSKIREIYIPGSVTHFGDAIFYRAFELEKAEIGEGMAELPRAIFNHCKGLYFVKLPGTLKRISSSAFNDCPNLPEISIPASVEYIGSSAFSDCRELTSITFEGKIPPDISASNVFGGCISLEKLLVPRGTRSDYLGVLSAAGVPESIIVEYGDGESGGGPAKPTEPAVKPPADKDKDKDNESGSGLNKPPSRDNPLDFSKLPTGAFKISGKAWTGKRIKSGLKISVSYSVGGRPATKALRENVDYNVTGYGKNKNIGKGTVTITGKAGSIYKAAISLSFKIVPKKPTGLKLKAGKKSLKVTFKKVSKAQKVKTYKVEYRVKGNKKWKSKTVRVKLTGKAGKKKTASLTLKKLKSKKTYQVRVYAYKGAYKGAPTKSKNRRIR